VCVCICVSASVHNLTRLDLTRLLSPQVDLTDVAYCFILGCRLRLWLQTHTIAIYHDLIVCVCVCVCVCV